ncbi:MAG: hypothetical protein H6678_06585 [Candidatus Delongbacteria bacterium]|nr:hypothetical protein [Candidatus Delongbacteria bacterium]
MHKLRALVRLIPLTLLLALLGQFYGCSSTSIPEQAALQARIDSLTRELDMVSHDRDLLLDRLERVSDRPEPSAGEADVESWKDTSGTPDRADVVDRRAALAPMQMRVDSVEHVSWYRDRSSPGYTNVSGFFLYIGQREDSDPWLRLRIQVNEGEWSFIESFIIEVDGKTWHYRSTEFDRDTGRSEWEWFDRNADRKDLEMARAVMNSSTAVIRYKGRQFQKDREITAEQKQALRHVFAAYDALGE